MEDKLKKMAEHLLAAQKLANEIGLSNILTPGLGKEVITAARLGHKDIKTVISVVMTEKDGITPCEGFRYPYNRVLKGNKQTLWQDLTPDEKKAEAIRIREELKKIL